MLTALISFLGTTAFRLIWGEISSYVNKRTEHSQEIERLELQEKLAAAAHSRELESIRLQAEQKIQVIRVQAESAIDEATGKAWATIAESTSKQTGIFFLDIWNGMIRPGCATWAICMLSLEALKLISPLSDTTLSLCGASLGLYLAQRDLFRRNKT